MGTVDVDNLAYEAVKSLQMAKRAAKIFPEGVSIQDVYASLASSYNTISYDDIAGAVLRLGEQKIVRIYPTIHEKRVIIESL